MENYNDIELSHEEEQDALRRAREAKHYAQKTHEYWEKVKNPPKPLIHSFEDLRKLAIDRGSKMCSEFVIDNHNIHAFVLLCRYFSGDPEFEKNDGLKLEKGLLLYGNVGVGKTTMMKIFSRNHVQCYSTVSCNRIVEKYNEEGDIGEYYAGRKVAANETPYLHEYHGHCFDDLGTESIPGNFFGKQKNVMADVLQARYSNPNIPFNMTHITTNLSKDELKNIYGSRVYDRMREMFNLIEFTGSESRRK